MEVKKCEMVERSNANGELICLWCEKPLVRKQRKFCCREHKNNYNHKHLYNYSYQKAHRARSPRNYLGQLRSYYNRRATLSLDFLEDLYYRQEGLCALTGKELTFVQDGGRTPTNISIDRINSSVGYLETNVQLVCHQVNTMKSDLSVTELRSWCESILGKRD